MFSFLTKPKIKKVLEDQLYEAQRARIDAIASLANAETQIVSARTAVALAKAQVAYTEARVQALRGDLDTYPEGGDPTWSALTRPEGISPARPWVPSLEAA